MFKNHDTITYTLYFFTFINFAGEIKKTQQLCSNHFVESENPQAAM